jgi:hypothetical protein
MLLKITEPNTAHYSILRQGEHTTGSLKSAQPEEIPLQRLQEYAIAIYADGYMPMLLSLSTNDILQQSLPIEVRLKKLSAGEEPLNFTTTRSASTLQRQLVIENFDLENVNQRSAAIMALSEARKILGDFYTHGKLSAPFQKRSDDFSPQKIEESSRSIARQLFNAEKQLEHFKLQRETLSAQISPANCNTLEAYWRARLAEDKAARDVQDLRLKYHLANQAKQEMQGERFDQAAYKMHKNTLDAAQNRYEISMLQSRSQYAECMSRTLQAAIDSLENTGQTSSIEARQKRLQIDRARVEEQAAIAYRMYRKHNQQALHFSGREQWEELARAQKQIANYNKAQYLASITKFELSRIDLELNPGNTAYINSLNKAQTEAARWAEVQYQSDMGYAEWMWALRKQLDVASMADDIYVRHNRLMDIAPLSSRNESTDGTEDVTLLQDAGLRITVDSTGAERAIRFGEDTYEIIQHSDGTYSYRKNDRPVTALTYRFETERLFGEFLNNIKVEENRTGLRDVFRRVAGLD